MLTRRGRRAGAVSPLSVCNRRSPTCGERGPSAPCLCAFDGHRHAWRAGGVSPLSASNRRSPTCGERGPSAPCLCAIDGRRHAASGGVSPPVCVGTTVDGRRPGASGRCQPPVYVQSAAADMRRAGGVSPLSVCNRRPPTCGERGASAPCLCAIDGRRHAASGGRQPLSGDTNCDPPPTCTDPHS